MKTGIFKALRQSLADKVPCATVTDTETGQQCLYVGSECMGDLVVPDAALATVSQMIQTDSSGVLENTSLFVRVYGPPFRMIIVGAVHIAQALAPMAQSAGYEVTIIDPREAFASAERLAGIAVLSDWPDEGMVKVKPDIRTAVVTLTHDPKLDDPALEQALKSDAFYIGSLGSRRTHGKRLERLRESGFTDEDLSRIHGPAGLDIKAKSPAEIAVSILAQVVATRRQAQV
ncbi:MAG: XdhC family protein [Rhodospirillaceae bacterium]